MPIRRTIALILVMLLILVGGTLTAVKLTTDHLLYDDATSTARSWAEYLADNVKDLKQIASGEQPSTASVTFFQWAQRVPTVSRYEIFNREGYSQLVSDRQRISAIDLAELNPSAALVAKTGEPVVATEKGEPGGQASFVAKAFIPVMF